MRSLEFPPTERFLLHNSLDLLESIDERIAAADAELLATAAVEEQARLLMTIPGVGIQDQKRVPRRTVYTAARSAPGSKAERTRESEPRSTCPTQRSTLQRYPAKNPPPAVIT